MLSWKFCQIVMKKLIFKFCNFCHFSTTFFLWFINASMITFTICISENVLEEKSRRKSPPKCLLWSGRKYTQVKETEETYYTNCENELKEANLTALLLTSFDLKMLAWINLLFVYQRMYRKKSLDGKVRQKVYFGLGAEKHPSQRNCGDLLHQSRRRVARGNQKVSDPA